MQKYSLKEKLLSLRAKLSKSVRLSYFSSFFSPVKVNCTIIQFTYAGINKSHEMTRHADESPSPCRALVLDAEIRKEIRDELVGPEPSQSVVLRIGYV